MLEKLSNFRILKANTRAKKEMVVDNSNTDENYFDKTVNTVESVDIEERHNTAVR